ncbi:5'/3'-nucleotidase SurE [Petrocella sp. FN5]|uniref:5'/3'-nucleotidase SurE n=1 Tax=Petrocella sp. FN5 TaxID=3032002 RepID=UPI0023DB4FCA|nr:5'/3'-nucleotidase SurE [Petrocella sp. FN5]MDF1617877.1 5'/3'-nucleotidase SurE [Petrocella sp. FN5]
MMDDLKKNAKKLVLLTNDDGIGSPGLKALAEALDPLCELLIVAPRFQQTGMGRGALSGDQVGIIQKLTLNINGKELKAYSVYGSPAQSVVHGILELTNKKPDYCISGINYGENLGLAFTCSGTLGATFEADSWGIPAIAFSRSIPHQYQKSEDFMTLDWEIEKVMVQRLISDILEKGMPDQVKILNVNFPTNMTSNTEVRMTKQAYMNYGNYIHPGQRDYSQGHQLEWRINNRLHEAPKDSDIYAIHFDQVISVTPMTSLMSVDADTYHR